MVPAAESTQIHIRQGHAEATWTLGSGGGGRDVGQRWPVGEEEQRAHAGGVGARGQRRLGERYWRGMGNAQKAGTGVAGSAEAGTVSGGQ